MCTERYEEFKLKPNLNLNLYREIPRNSIFLILTSLAKISPPWRFAICILMTISSLIFSGTGHGSKTSSLKIDEIGKFNFLDSDLKVAKARFAETVRPSQSFMFTYW